MKAIRSTRGDKLYRSEFRDRMTGDGPMEKIIRQRFELARKRAGIKVARDFELNCELFSPSPDVHSHEGQGAQLQLL